MLVYSVPASRIWSRHTRSVCPVLTSSLVDCALCLVWSWLYWFALFILSVLFYATSPLAVHFAVPVLYGKWRRRVEPVRYTSSKSHGAA